MSSRWKSRSSFTSGLLARSTEAQPLNAPSPSVPVRPLIITIEPLSRTSALADSGACNRPGASSASSTGMFCRSSGGAGIVALISNLSGCVAGVRAAGDLDLAVGADHGVGVDALDAAVHAVAQIGKYDGAVGHRDAIDARAFASASPEDVAGLADGVDCARCARAAAARAAPAVDDEFGDLRMARPQARQRHVGLRRCRWSGDCCCRGPSGPAA